MIYHVKSQFLSTSPRAEVILAPIIMAELPSVHRLQEERRTGGTGSARAPKARADRAPTSTVERGILLKSMWPDSVPRADLRGEGGMMSEAQPAACYRSQLTTISCRACGERTDLVHFPTRYIGCYCSKCCPACNPKPAAKE
jgi:hypothetical protein